MRIQNRDISGILGTAERLKEAGTNSRRVGAEKAHKALFWVYQWGYSTPTLVDGWASPTRAGLCKRLVDQGLLASWPAPGAGGTKGVPHKVVTLTKAGETLVLAGLERVDQLLDQEQADEVKWRQLRHDILVQRATLNMSPHHFFTPKQIKIKSVKGVKQPDVVWGSESGERMGVELELTLKKRGREIDQTVLALLHSLKEENPFRLTSIRIFSPSKMILKDYETRLRPGSKIDLWVQDSRRHWGLSGQTQTVPNWSLDRIDFVEIEL